MVSTDAPVNLTSSLGYTKTGAAEGTVILQPEGGYEYFNITTFNGFIKIKIPTTAANSMLSFDIDVFDYLVAGNEGFKLRVSGHLYGSWAYDRAATVITGNPSFIPQVKFGGDAGAYCIFLSGPNGAARAWNYASVRISNVCASYRNSTFAKVGEPWVITQETTLGDVYHTLDPKLVSTDSLNSNALGNTPATDIKNAINDLASRIAALDGGVSNYF